MVAQHESWDKMEADGLTYKAYTTHSHGNPEKPGMRARIVIPVDSVLNIENYPFQIWVNTFGL